METGKFFFSYGRADAEFVLKLAADLRSNGTNVWFDQLDIPAGARWDRAVEEALHASPCLLVVLSPASVATTLASSCPGYRLNLFSFSFTLSFSLEQNLVP